MRILYTLLTVQALNISNFPCYESNLAYFDSYYWHHKNLAAYIEHQSQNQSLVQICEEKKFSHSKYQALIYARYCDPQEFKLLCQLNDHLCELAKDTISAISNVVSDTRLIKSDLKNDVMQVQVSTIPGCGFQTFGFSKTYHLKNRPSRYTLVQAGCRFVLVFSFILLILITLISTLGNLLVMIVMIKFMDMTTTQNFLKIGIAVSDFLTGCVVLPGSLAIFKRIYFDTIPFHGFYDCMMTTETNTVIIRHIKPV